MQYFWRACLEEVLERSLWHSPVSMVVLLGPRFTVTVLNYFMETMVICFPCLGKFSATNRFTARRCSLFNLRYGFLAPWQRAPVKNCETFWLLFGQLLPVTSGVRVSPPAFVNYFPSLASFRASNLKFFWNRWLDILEVCCTRFLICPSNLSIRNCEVTGSAPHCLRSAGRCTFVCVVGVRHYNELWSTQTSRTYPA